MKKLAFLIIMMLMAVSANAQWAANKDTGIHPRGVTVETLGENETVYVGALINYPRRVVSATYIRVKADEAFTITFNGGPVLYAGTTEDVVAGVSSDYSVGNTVPISANEWHIFKCSATQLTLTDCDGGTATIIVEY
jgi:hypothetical protein